MVAGRLGQATRSKRVYHTFIEEIFMKALTRKLRKVLKAKKLSNQKGFTLLELLVVVAILAAIAGTASIALRDTDARASAAAHVAMMDELNKGIHTYRVLNKNVLPNRFDSLMEAANTTAAGVNGADYLGTASVAAGSDAVLGFEVGTGPTATGDGAVPATIPDGVQQILVDGGIDELRYAMNVNTSNPEGDGDCSDISALIASRGNDVVAGNIFLSPDANGCGGSFHLEPDDTADDTNDPAALFWAGGTERLTGQQDPAGAETNYNATNNYAYLLLGIGPACTLFDTNTLGGMTTVPVYRHVKANEYNRFMSVWNVGTYDADGDIVAAASAELVAIIDGALDTKEEELGEWDGTRNTI
jgi:prepilin-type N-terminal cleavage/methylation domain-containing protein